jgi:glutathione S-transferase
VIVLRLNDYVLSPEAYTVRLMLALMRVPYETVAVDAYPGGGKVPVLNDGVTVLEDPGLILTYLARGRDPWWLPQEHAAEISQWLAFAALELSALNDARQMRVLGLPGDFNSAVTKGRAALRKLEDALTARHLAGIDWLAADHATIADVAVFPAATLSHDSGTGHEDYPAVNLWQRRVRKLQGFVGMPGIPDYF